MSPRPVILAIDDDPDFLDFLEAVLKEKSYRLLRATNKKEALRILRGITPHLILLDIHMPDVDGYTLYQELQRWNRLATIPIIFVTAANSEQDRLKALSIGAADFLEKPISPEDLLAKVAFHLETQRRWRELDQILSHLSTPEQQSFSSTQTKLRQTFSFQRFREYLVDRGIIPEKFLSDFFQIDPKNIYSFAKKLGLSEEQMAQHIGKFLNLPVLLHLTSEQIWLDALPHAFCENYQVIGLQYKGQKGYALSNPFDFELIQILQLQHHGGNPKLFIAPPRLIQKALSGALHKSEEVIRTLEEQLKNRYLEEEPAETEREQEDRESTEPLIVLVNKIIEDAYEMGASDIHIEPWEEEVVIRYRIDGTLRIVNRLRPRNMIRPIAARIKVMSRLNIAEKRIPQDGRIVFKKYTKKDLDFDLRVSTAPMNFGEKIVMRILDKQKSVWPLEKLGFSKRHLEIYREAIRSPYGMILHVGPTGSGKSMTLYAALSDLASPEINIQTIEDPIEYTLSGINQLQVNHDIGLTFAKALRSFLRQDPDIILVGEIRDRETAEIAVEAALTGHLLFSTLHTNDAPTTVTRFFDMGIEPFLVSATLVLVCAQRLIRRLCPHCKKVRRTTPREMEILGLKEAIPIFAPQGCPRCNSLGYKGRIGVHELFVPNESIRHAITQEGVSSDHLKQLAVREIGMTTLFWDGVEKVLDGITSLEEVRIRLKRDAFDSRPSWLDKKLAELAKKRQEYTKPTTASAPKVQQVTVKAETGIKSKLAKLQTIYLSKLPEKLKLLRDKWNQWKEGGSSEALQELSGIFHKIAGSGGSYGFSDLSQLARQGEYLAKTQPFTKEEEGQMEEVFQTFEAWLRKHQDQGSSTEAF